VLSERRKAERDGLDRLRDAGREEARADLGSAGLVHDRDAAAADVLEQPQVRIAVPRLARGAERLQRRQVRRRLAVRDQCAHAPPPTTVHGPMIQPMSVAKWMRSPGLTSVWYATSRAIDARNPPCTCRAPFGFPVVPDV